MPLHWRLSRSCKLPAWASFWGFLGSRILACFSGLERSWPTQATGIRRTRNSPYLVWDTGCCCRSPWSKGGGRCSEGLWISRTRCLWGSWRCFQKLSLLSEGSTVSRRAVKSRSVWSTPFAWRGSEWRLWSRAGGPCRSGSLAAPRLIRACPLTLSSDVDWCACWCRRTESRTAGVAGTWRRKCQRHQGWTAGSRTWKSGSCWGRWGSRCGMRTWTRMKDGVVRGCLGRRTSARRRLRSISVRPRSCTSETAWKWLRKWRTMLFSTVDSIERPR